MNFSVLLPTFVSLGVSFWDLWSCYTISQSLVFFHPFTQVLQWRSCRPLVLFQDESLNNLTSLSQASQKDLFELPKGNPDLPIISLRQLNGILTCQPLQPEIFIHLIHQLIMEITPGHLTDDINLICPEYPKKIMYISKQKQTELNDFGTIQLGKCCNLILETIFCKLNNTKLIFHKQKDTYIFPIQLPNEKYRAVIADIKHNTLTYYTTEHNMTQSEKNRAQKSWKPWTKIYNHKN